MHYVIHLVSYIGYICSLHSYNDINFTYLYMCTNYLCHLANIVDIRWSRPVWGGGGGGNSQLNWLTSSKRQKSVVTLRLQTNMMLYSRQAMDKLYYSKFNFFVKIIPTISNFYIYHKYMTHHMYYSIF